MNTANTLRLVDITPFLRGFKDMDQAAIDAENSQYDLFGGAA